MSPIRKIFGIDLGTTYSAIAYVDEHGLPVVVKNTSENGQALLPSVVLVEPGGDVVVGSAAKSGAIADPDRVFEEIKRSMGNPNFYREIDDWDYRPETVSSFILKKLTEYAAVALGEPVEDVVITVPAYFTESEIQATRNAGRIAGLNVVGIVAEPTAAAFAYGQNLHEGQTVLVFDLGGGTFDVTILRVETDARRVLVTGGDHDLGGRRWDQALVGYVAARFQEQTGVDPLDDPYLTQDLWLRCEDAKRSLSVRGSVSVPIVHGGHRASIEITRATFDEITAHLLRNAMDLTQDLIAAAREKRREQGGEFEGLDAILLVGGSTRMPQIQNALRTELGVEPLLFDPDEAVAKGAALYALKLRLGELLEPAGGEADREPTPAERQRAYDEAAAQVGLPSHVVRSVVETRLINVLAHSVGVVVGHERRVERQLKAQTELPVESQQRYGTLEDDQESVQIVIVQGEGGFEGDCTILNTAENLLDVPPGLPAGAPIDITLTIDAEGSLHVDVVDLTGGNRIEFTPRRPGVMTREEVDRAARAVRPINVM